MDYICRYFSSYNLSNFLFCKLKFYAECFCAYVHYIIYVKKKSVCKHVNHTAESHTGISLLVTDKYITLKSILTLKE